MDGFKSVLNIINYLDYRPKYDNEKCVKSISPKASCTICKDICNNNSININRRSISIEESCNFCNECISHCPTNALVDSGKKYIGRGNKIYILCGEHKIDEDIDYNLKLACLNFMNTKILLNIYRAGYREIHTNIDKCDDCNKGTNLDRELIKTNEILSKLNKPLMSIENEDLESIINSVRDIRRSRSHTEVDRRGFFKQLAKEFYSKAYEIAPPASREQFWDSTVDILKEWQEDKVDKLSVFDVIVDNKKCIQCNACIKLCPQKVWEIKEDCIEQRLDLCNGCQLCKDICPSKAIEIREDIQLISRQTFKKAIKSCIKCGKEYAGYKEEIDTCPSCIGKEVFRS